MRLSFELVILTTLLAIVYAKETADDKNATAVVIEPIAGAYIRNKTAVPAKVIAVNESIHKQEPVINLILEQANVPKLTNLANITANGTL